MAKKVELAESEKCIFDYVIDRNDKNISIQKETYNGITTETINIGNLIINIKEHDGLFDIHVKQTWNNSEGRWYRDLTEINDDIISKLAFASDGKPFFYKLYEMTNHPELGEYLNGTDTSCNLKDVTDRARRALSIEQIHEINKWIFDKLPERYHTVKTRYSMTVYEYLFDAKTLGFDEKAPIYSIYKFTAEQQMAIHQILPVWSSIKDPDVMFLDDMETKEFRLFNNIKKARRYSDTIAAIDKDKSKLILDITKYDLNKILHGILSKIDRTAIITSSFDRNKKDDNLVLKSINGMYIKKLSVPEDYTDMDILNAEYDFYKKLSKGSIIAMDIDTINKYRKISKLFDTMCEYRYKYSDYDIDQEIEKIRYLIKYTSDISHEATANDNGRSFVKFNIEEEEEESINSRSYYLSDQLNITEEDILKFKFIIKLNKLVADKKIVDVIKMIKQAPFTVDEIGSFEKGWMSKLTNK